MGELCGKWEEVFKCPLAWHFSCAEVGSLYTVKSSSAMGTEGHCVEGLKWRIEDGELWAHGKGLFERYYGRPRSTSEAFHTEDGFCRTFHPVAEEYNGLFPAPRDTEVELEMGLEKHLIQGPDARKNPWMAADWTLKKVPMRKYELWRTAWGGIDYTKKHNTAWKIYRSKYK